MSSIEPTFVDKITTGAKSVAKRTREGIGKMTKGIKETVSKFSTKSADDASVAAATGGAAAATGGTAAATGGTAALQEPVGEESSSNIVTGIDGSAYLIMAIIGVTSTAIGLK